MLSSNAYDYINVLSKAADASWLRNEVIANNIANEDTPGYKRQDVDFESVLEKELGHNHLVDLDSRVASVKTSRLKVGAYVDAASYSYRTDGNNVDVENEQIYLAENQLKYQGLINSITSEFSNLKTVMK